MEPQEILGEDAALKRERSELPNLDRALEYVAGNVKPETIAYGHALAELWRVDQSTGDWVNMLESYETRHEDAASRVRAIGRSRTARSSRRRKTR